MLEAKRVCVFSRRTMKILENNADSKVWPGIPGANGWKFEQSQIYFLKIPSRHSPSSSGKILGRRSTFFSQQDGNHA